MIAMRGSKGPHRCFPLLGGPVPFFLSKAWEEFGVKCDWLCISLQELGLGQSLTLPGGGGSLLSSVETPWVLWSGPWRNHSNTPFLCLLPVVRQSLDLCEAGGFVPLNLKN